MSWVMSLTPGASWSWPGHGSAWAGARPRWRSRKHASDGKDPSANRTPTRFILAPGFPACWLLACGSPRDSIWPEPQINQDHGTSQRRNLATLRGISATLSLGIAGFLAIAALRHHRPCFVLGGIRDERKARCGRTGLLIDSSLSMPISRRSRSPATCRHAGRATGRRPWKTGPPGSCRPCRSHRSRAR